MRNLKDMRPNPLARKDPARDSDLKIKICEPDTVLHEEDLIANDLSCQLPLQQADKHIFWDNVNIQTIRDANERARLGYLLAQYRSSAIQKEVRYLGEKITTLIAEERPGKKRKTTSTS